MILILMSTKIMGVTIECKGERGRFGRGLLGADSRFVSPPVEPFPSSKRRKTMGAMEELSVHLSGLSYSWCRARVE
jgi:hypothetical protein